MVYTFTVYTWNIYIMYWPPTIPFLFRFKSIIFCSTVGEVFCVTKTVLIATKSTEWNNIYGILFKYSAFRVFKVREILLRSTFDLEALCLGHLHRGYC